MTPVEITEEDGIVIARLNGEIDLAGVEQVTTHLLSSVPNEAVGLVMDFSSVTYLDSAGIQMLFDVIRRLQTSRQGIAIAVPEESNLATLFKITHLHEACPLAPTVEDCITALRRGAKLY